MENPNTWNVVQRTIDEAIREFEDSVEAGEYGYSMPTVIYRKLLERGLLREQDSRGVSGREKSTVDV